jgi:hypothetical protein
MAEIKSHIKEHEDTFGHPAVTSRERLEAIADMLADIKQLRQPLVSGRLPKAEDVKRWYQLLVGKSEIEMQKDIEATFR